MSIDTDSIQYENDELMRPMYGDDYCIACCVSAMAVGKQMQFFGARANLAKSLLYAINGGVDEKKGLHGGAGHRARTRTRCWTTPRCWPTTRRCWPMWPSCMWTPSTSSTIMHDKYAYEASQMALHDTLVERLAAFGVAGLSIAADSLSAIKFAKVRPVRNEQGIAVDFEIGGRLPQVRQRRRPGGRHRGGDRLLLLGGAEKASPLPQRHPHPLRPDHHQQRDVRQKDRLHPGRAQGGRALRPRRQPHARPG